MNEKNAPRPNVATGVGAALLMPLLGLLLGLAQATDYDASALAGVLTALAQGTAAYLAPKRLKAAWWALCAPVSVLLSGAIAFFLVGTYDTAMVQSAVSAAAGFVCVAAFPNTSG